MPSSSDRSGGSCAARILVWVLAGGEAAASATIASVVAHTSPETPVVLAAGGHPPRLVRGPDHLRDADQDAFTGAVDAYDVAVVTAPCAVTPGWLEGLRAAAHSDPQVAAAVALDIAGQPGGEALLGERAAAARDRAPAVPRRLGAGAGACVYRRASATQLTGVPGPDPGFETATREHGLSVVLAEGVLVAGQPAPTGGRSAGEGGAATAGPEPALRDALAAERRRWQRLSVLIDARALAGARDGTRTHLLELLTALCGHGAGRVAVSALIPPGLDAETRRRLTAIAGLSTIVLEPSAPVPPDLHADVAHRPLQIAADAEMLTLRGLADRVVITHQDLISYHEPDYFADAGAFSGYRAMTARALGGADAVLFFSAHVRDQALAEGLVDPARCHVVGLTARATAGEAGDMGRASATVGRVAGGAMPAGRPPGLGAEDPAVPILLCLGSDYRHKNRPFAIAVHAALRRRHGWRGHLVLAGPRVRWGSSAALERAAIAASPDLQASVRDLGEVSDAQRDWLLSRASLVLYPTLQEGFGLVPFEAAAHRRPCLWAAGSSLAEILPATAARITPWDADASAAAAHRLLTDFAEAGAVIDAVSGAAAELTPARLADRLITAYRAVCEQPPRAADGGALSEDAVRLVGPDGLLPREIERPLLALAARERFARPAFAALAAAYRLSHWTSGRRRAPR
ncbi:MAG TPA: glycosyltransferase [Solirubrobacteraceae bacterium]|nr:glycosyltransferase [Solirubrobacteraceae bacterium]